MHNIIYSKSYYLFGIKHNTSREPVICTIVVQYVFTCVIICSMIKTPTKNIMNIFLVRISNDDDDELLPCFFLFLLIFTCPHTHTHIEMLHSKNHLIIEQQQKKDTCLNAKKQKQQNYHHQGDFTLIFFPGHCDRWLASVFFSNSKWMATNQKNRADIFLFCFEIMKIFENSSYWFLILFFSNKQHN